MLAIRVIWASIFLLLITLGTANAQHGQGGSQIEELTQQLENSAGSDRIELLHRLSSRISFQNTQLATEYAEEALDLSKALNSDSLIAESHYFLGYASVFTDKKSVAINNFIDAQIIFERLGEKANELRVLQVLGSSYVDISEYERASELYFKSLEYARELGDERGEVFALTKLGLVQQNLEEYRIAQRFLHDAIHKAREIGDWGGESIALSEAGFLEEKNGNLEKAAEYYQEAIDLFKDKGYQHAVPQLMINIANIYQDEDRLSEALEMADHAVKLADSLGNTFMALHNLDEVAEVYYEMGEYDQATSILEEGIEKAEEAGFSNTTQFLLNKLSHMQLNEGDLTASRDAAFKAKTMALSVNDWRMAENNIEILIEVAKQTGAYDEATAYHEELIAIRDSILDEERAKNLVEFEARFRIGEREQEIAALQAENERRSIIQASLAGGLALFIVIGLLIVRSQRHKIQKGEAELEVSKLKSKELQRDIEFKNKQLTSQSLNMVQKNEMMEEMKEKVENLKKEVSSRELNSLSRLVDQSFSLDEDWKQFKMHFEEVHSGFYHILKERYSDLTPNEMRLSALVKLNLTIKEMAAILGISPDSVKTARYRLRKKLDLNTEDNLTEFMIALEKESLEVS